MKWFWERVVKTSDFCVIAMFICPPLAIFLELRYGLVRKSSRIMFIFMCLFWMAFHCFMFRELYGDFSFKEKIAEFFQTDKPSQSEVIKDEDKGQLAPDDEKSDHSDSSITITLTPSLDDEEAIIAIMELLRYSDGSKAEVYAYMLSNYDFNDEELKSTLDCISEDVWNYEALQLAIDYNADACSERYVRNRLYNYHKFEVSQVDYAMNNVNFDWNKNALHSAISFSDNYNYDKEKLYTYLIEDDYQWFTAEQAQYAIDNIDTYWNAEALSVAKYYKGYADKSNDEIYKLLSEEGFPDEQIKYALDNL